MNLSTLKNWLECTTRFLISAKSEDVSVDREVIVYDEENNIKFEILGTKSSWNSDDIKLMVKQLK